MEGADGGKNMKAHASTDLEMCLAAAPDPKACGHGGFLCGAEPQPLLNQLREEKLCVQKELGGCDSAFLFG